MGPAGTGVIGSGRAGDASAAHSIIATLLRTSSSTGRAALVVDEDRNLYAITGILELRNVRVLQAENGRTVIDAAVGAVS